MRMIRLVAACAALLALSGCADWYYQMIGRPEWPHEAPNLYSRLGGRPGLQRSVDQLAVTLAADPRTAPFFARTDGSRFRPLLTDQLCTLSGGPFAYGGYSMQDAHQGMGITPAAFDAFLDDLDQALAANGTRADDRRQLLRLLAPMRNEIVTAANEG